MNKESTIQKEQTTALKNYPGAAINKADKNKVSPEMVKERVKTQNNNPRNND